MYPNQNSTNSINDSKQYNMKQFLNAAKEYSQTRAEETANVLNRYLQLLGVTIDTNIFDPHTNIVCEFFVSLHELLTSVETKSTLAWCCVNVLAVACRNPAARQALIHTYQFLPALSRLLGDHLTIDKKVRLLRLMQDLTCGIRISWQIQHLPYLMQVLTKWIESQEHDIVCLSLAVVVNLCYKNIPAIYTLSRVVDIKQFIKTLMQINDSKTEMHICKLLIILDDMNDVTNEHAVPTLIRITFKSALEAFRTKDCVLLRHVVEFFIDVKNRSKCYKNFQDYPNYKIEIEKLIGVLEAIRAESGDDEFDLECISGLFEFLKALLNLKISAMVEFYPKIIQITMKWISSERVSSPALSILRLIATQKHENPVNILEPLVQGVPVFLLALDLKTIESNTVSLEQYKLLSELMQLLKILVQTEIIREKVVGKLKEKTLSEIFIPLLNDRSPREKCQESHSLDELTFYVQTLGLINELEKYDARWINVFCSLVQQKQIHMILSQALFTGNEDVKLTTLEIMSHKLFPRKDVSLAMMNLQVLANNPLVPEMPRSEQHHEEFTYPILTVSQNERLEEIMERVKIACENNSFGQSVSMSDVMELYEYKVASIGHAERASLASMEAASQRCVHLQHRVAQLTAELTRLHQLMFNLQQNYEEIVKEKKDFGEKLKDVGNRLSTESNKRKLLLEQVQEKDKFLVEKVTQLESLSQKYENLYAEKESVCMKNSELMAAIQKLEKTLTKYEEVRESYKKQIARLERQIEKSELELKDKNAQLLQVNEELNNSNVIIDTIKHMAATKETLPELIKE